LETCQKEIAKNSQDQFDESHQIGRIQKEIEEFGNIAGTYRDLTLQHNELGKKVTTAKHDLEQSQKQLQQAKSHQYRLSTHEYDPNCQYCCNNEFVKEASKLIERIPILENEIKTRNAEHVELVGMLEISHLEVKHAEAFENLLKDRQDAKARFQRFTDLAGTLQYKHNSLQTKLDQCLGRLEKYKENEKTIEENKLTHQKIESSKLEIAQTEAEIQQLEGQEKTEFSKLASLQAQHSAIDEKLDKYAEYVKKSRIYELYQTAVGRDGVPYRILETVLPVIEDEVNSILNSMVNFTVKMESTDDKYITASIVYGDVKYWPVELSSGMERFVLSLAFRSSLTEITSLPKANFLTIDEGFGVLDNENLMSMGNLFNFLKQQYDFIVCVSHIDAMRDMVDSHIKIDKCDGYSRIKL
jgi:DNA repair exonuclease SbcCD ATPase subunit